MDTIPPTADRLKKRAGGRSTEPRDEEAKKNRSRMESALRNNSVDDKLSSARSGERSQGRDEMLGASRAQAILEDL